MKRSTNEEIASVLNISMRKMDRVKKRFIEEGIGVTLNGEKGRRIYAKSDSITHETVRQVLKKTKLSPGNEKDG